MFPVIYPGNTVEGELMIHLAKTSGRPRAVTQHMDGFPSNELLYYPPNGAAAQLLPRHLNGHWTDMLPWWGDWNRFETPIY
jgi:hypothetical protein